MTPGPVEPMTLAGRFLFADRDMHSPECPRWKALGSPDAPCDCTLPEHILAIEAEAGRREAATYALLDRMLAVAFPKTGEPATVPPTGLREASPDKLMCGQCGDWLRLEDIDGHLASEGRVPVDALGVVLDRLETALPEGWDLMFGTDRKHGGQGGWWATASQPTQEHGGYRIVSTTADHRKTDPTLIEAVENLLERLAREPSL